MSQEADPEIKDIKPNLKEVVSGFPQVTGVYLMKAKTDKIIYVGKAKNLRSRVKSYLSDVADLSSKTKLLVKNLFKIEYIITRSEIEALLLEASLIKKHRPRYNIRLKDDKSYPYIKVSLSDDFPRFYLARKVKRDGSLYYGPYSSGFFVRETIKFLNRTFQIRDCSDSFMKSRKRPCITHQIGRCSAPCVELITAKDYGQSIKNSIKFLQGKKTKLMTELKEKMFSLADDEKFEMAAKVRDSVKSLEKILERQTVINANSDRDQDVIGFFGDESGTLVETIHVRAGRVLGNKSHFFPLIDTQNSEEDIREWLTSFISQYYEDNLIPDELILPIDIGNDLRKLLEQLFKDQYEKQVLITFPTSKDGQELLAMANKNSESHFNDHVSKSEKKKQGLEVIQKKLGLKDIPHRIECFDISTFQGTETVGSQVVFEDGVPCSEEYRLYKIKTVQGTNDFASMHEMLNRRFQHEEWQNPDLIVIDGGKGQLSIAVEVLKELAKSHIPVVGLAKERTKQNFEAKEIEKTEERFYLPGRSNPVTFAVGSPAFQILVGIRDEAHRFAITFHRKRREQGSLASELDVIDGLSEIAKQKLLTKFETVEGILEADLKELEKLDISKSEIKKIVSFIKSARD